MNETRLLILSIIVLLGFFATELCADSIFGSRSFGIPVVHLDGRSWAMGGVSAALGGENFSSSNPASISNFYRAGLTGLMIPEYRRPEDVSGTVNLRSFSIPIARVVFPLRHRFVAAAGIQQDIDLNWRFDGEREFQGEVLGEYLGNEGSLFSLSATVARSFGTHLSLGAEVAFHRGEENRTWYLNPSQSDEGGTPYRSVDVTRNDLSGESITLGILLHPSRWIDVGFSLRPGYGLSIEESLDAGTGYTEEGSGHLDMPRAYILGVSLNAGRRLTLGADFESSPWEDTGSSEVIPFAMRHYRRLSFGLEFTPSSDPLAPSWKKWPLRTGVMYRMLPSLVNGNGVNEWSYMAGMGIVMGNGRGRMDIFTQYTRRGSLQEIGATERIIRFGISLSGFEKWVPRRKGRPL